MIIKRTAKNEKILKVLLNKVCGFKYMENENEISFDEEIENGMMFTMRRSNDGQISMAELVKILKKYEDPLLILNNMFDEDVKMPLTVDTTLSSLFIDTYNWDKVSFNAVDLYDEIKGKVMV